MNTNLVEYYKQRAAEYEAIYHKPERQKDIAAVSTILENIFTEKGLIEIACGTGFWTQKIAEVATFVHATDINQPIIDLARQKHYTKANVSFEVADFFYYHTNQKFESLFGGFIWSHILIEQIDTFIANINNYVIPGGTVALIDNLFVPGSNSPITCTDKHGNTFQKRQLTDGSAHLVLKNFPEEAFIRSKLAGLAKEVNCINLQYYWVLTYKTLELL